MFNHVSYIWHDKGSCDATFLVVLPYYILPIFFLFLPIAFNGREFAFDCGYSWSLLRFIFALQKHTRVMFPFLTRSSTIYNRSLCHLEIISAKIALVASYSGAGIINTFHHETMPGNMQNAVKPAIFR